jgi:DNA-binding CsgD family transcriptional regulator
LRAWDSFEKGSERLLRDLAGALGLKAGVLWLPQGDELVARAVWSGASIERSALDSALRPLRFARGVGAPGAAWLQREPIQQAISLADGRPAQHDSVLGGLHASVALPALTAREVLGVLEFYSASPVELSERLGQVLNAVGYELGSFFARRRGELSVSPLTARELEVLAQLAQGLTGREIAERLAISRATVKTHREHISAKLGVSDRTSAVAYALRGGLIE